MRLEIDDGLSANTKLYRYISLEEFLSFIETGQTHVTRIHSWDDTWEMILERVPTVDDKGKHLRSINLLQRDLFGQSWTLIPESDALWRIYSPNKTGVVVSTTVEKFRLINGLDWCYVGRVIYFDSVQDLLDKAELSKSPFHNALLKRSAFKHEEEVRLITHLKELPVDYSFKGIYVNLELDPVRFVDSIIIDPRAEEWFVTTIKRYCNRVGFTIEPEKSSLYDPDPHLRIGIVKRIVPVEKDD